jgi:hypothetical protein
MEGVPVLLLKCFQALRLAANTVEQRALAKEDDDCCSNAFRLYDLLQTLF